MSMRDLSQLTDMNRWSNKTYFVYLYVVRWTNWYRIQCIARIRNEEKWLIQHPKTTKHRRWLATQDEEKERSGREDKEQKQNANYSFTFNKFNSMIRFNLFLVLKVSPADFCPISSTTNQMNDENETAIEWNGWSWFKLCKLCESLIWNWTKLMNCQIDRNSDWSRKRIRSNA